MFLRNCTFIQDDNSPTSCNHKVSSEESVTALETQQQNEKDMLLQLCAWRSDGCLRHMAAAFKSSGHCVPAEEAMPDSGRLLKCANLQRLARAYQYGFAHEGLKSMRLARTTCGSRSLLEPGLLKNCINKRFVHGNFLNQRRPGYP